MPATDMVPFMYHLIAPPTCTQKQFNISQVKSPAPHSPLPTYVHDTASQPSKCFVIHMQRYSGGVPLAKRTKRRMLTLVILSANVQTLSLAVFLDAHSPKRISRWNQHCTLDNALEERWLAHFHQTRSLSSSLSLSFFPRVSRFLFPFFSPISKPLLPNPKGGCILAQGC